jgi:hypothetical protein
LAADNAGNNSAAKMAMMAMTTSNSMSVKARRGFMPDRIPPLEIRFKLLLSISKCPPDGKTGQLFLNPSFFQPQAFQPTFPIWPCALTSIRPIQSH